MGQRAVQLDQSETEVWFQPKPKWGSQNHKSRSVSVQGSLPNPSAALRGDLQPPWDLAGHVPTAEASAAISSSQRTASGWRCKGSEKGRCAPAGMLWRGVCAESALLTVPASTYSPSAAPPGNPAHLRAEKATWMCVCGCTCIRTIYMCVRCVYRSHISSRWTESGYPLWHSSDKESRLKTKSRTGFNATKRTIRQAIQRPLTTQKEEDKPLGRKTGKMIVWFPLEEWPMVNNALKNCWLATVSKKAPL